MVSNIFFILFFMSCTSSTYNIKYLFVELKADTLYEVFLKNYKELVPHIKWGVSFSKNNTIEKNLSKNGIIFYFTVDIKKYYLVFY